ncbi:MAG: NifU family protein [Fusobacterium sp.]|nr:NifU family protein [Fusobacterium sp.]
MKQNGLKTVEEVTNFTKAGGACGRCKEAIKDIIDTYYKKEAHEESSLSPAQKILKISKVIETQIAPELQKDGGDITLVDIDGSNVYVKLRGKCSGCKNAMMTLKGFVENTLKEAVDRNIEVIEVE